MQQILPLVAPFQLRVRRTETSVSTMQTSQGADQKEGSVGPPGAAASDAGSAAQG